MATLAVEIDDDPASCVVVGRAKIARPASTKSTPSKNSKAPAMRSGQKPRPSATPAVKRGRGRAKKSTSNTLETAIVLSDDESDEAVNVDRKRSISQLETPIPAPAAKRYPPLVLPAAPTRAEVEYLRRQLAELRDMLEEKDASYHADLAAQIAPLQLQLQKVATEKHHLEASYKDLEDRLQAAWSGNKERRDNEYKNQECQASFNALEPATTAVTAAVPSTTHDEHTDSQLQAKDDIISRQAASIANLRKAEQEAKETLKELTVRHGAATTRIQEHEDRIQHLTQALSEARNAAATAIEKRTGAERACADYRERLGVVGRQNADAEAAIGELQYKLNASASACRDLEHNLGLAQRQLVDSDEMLAEVKRRLTITKDQLAQAKHQAPTQAQETITRLDRERCAMMNETQERLKQMEAQQTRYRKLLDAYKALKQEREQLVPATAAEEGLQQEPERFKSIVVGLQREKEQLQATILRLRQQLQERQELTTSKTREALKLYEGCGKLQGKITKLETDLAAQHKELEQQSVCLADKEAIIATKTSQIKQLQAAIATLTTEKSQLQSDLAIQKDQLQQLQTQLTQQQTKTRALEAPSTTANETIHSLRQQLTALTASMSSPKSDDESDNNPSTQTTTAIATTTTPSGTTPPSVNTTPSVTTTPFSTVPVFMPPSITALEQRLTNLSSTSKALESERATQDNQLKTLRAQVAQLTREVEALTDELAHRDGCLGRMRGG
ncbi:hypothetical protein N658DRAFT_543965 [Parathielavia hyrcaniae]|uniref:Uncharacterized protein n=1 Tax=Parathielavia hyrcaniae TaxID=113614 RepID=A0AAN6PXL2_9PEZI|nr:hypothetical protein N658DRAFT_543965 [Parathielavia hyrcaniae]